MYLVKFPRHARQTSFLLFVPLLAFLVSLPKGWDQAFPRQHLQTYALDGDTYAAEISPDEQLVAIQVTRSKPAGDPAKVEYTDLAQLWDFRQTPRGRGHPRPRRHGKVQTVSATYEGALRAVYGRSENRRLLYRPFPIRSGCRGLEGSAKGHLAGPPDVTQTFQTPKGPVSSVESWSLVALEVSPVAHAIAAVWSRAFAPSLLDIYDLDTGKILSERSTQALLDYMPIKALRWSG